MTQPDAFVQQLATVGWYLLDHVTKQFSSSVWITNVQSLSAASLLKMISILFEGMNVIGQSTGYSHNPAQSVRDTK
jgi:hypothetical protein